MVVMMMIMMMMIMMMMMMVMMMMVMMMRMMMIIFGGHSSCLIGLQERCAWSQSPVLRQSIVFCSVIQREDGSM